MTINVTANAGGLGATFVGASRKHSSYEKFIKSLNSNKNLETDMNLFLYVPALNNVTVSIIRHVDRIQDTLFIFTPKTNINSFS